jgi:hypothetical protein
MGTWFKPLQMVYRNRLLQMTCTKYGCDYELDLDGQVTCTVCGAMDDDIQPVNIDVIE